MRGVNAYAVLSSPRAAGNEAMVISASWLSRTGEGDGTLNLRGVATVLALARYLKRERVFFPFYSESFLKLRFGPRTFSLGKRPRFCSQ